MRKKSKERLYICTVCGKKKKSKKRVKCCGKSMITKEKGSWNL
jgi:hypothetical protein